jgi:hypothetical protein
MSIQEQKTQVVASLNSLYNAYERQVRHLSLTMGCEGANKFMEGSLLAKRITTLETIQQELNSKKEE